MTQETFAEMARRHRDADMLVAGNFLMIGGQACSIGCFCHDYGLEPSDFTGLAKLTGYPEAAHQLQEAIFEGLPETERADWHVAFAEKAATVTDWQTVIDKTVLASLRIVEPHDTSESKVVAAVIALYERRSNGDDPSEAEWVAAYTAATAAREDAWPMTAHDRSARAAGVAMHAARADASAAIVYAVGSAGLGAVRTHTRDAVRTHTWATADAAGDAADAARADAWVKIRNAFLNA
jgi:hypothetical protein